MEINDYVQKRRRKYLAQLLEAFEEKIEPLLPADSKDVDDFKGLVRAKMNALAIDSIDAHYLTATGQVINGYAQDTTDRLFPNGRPRIQNKQEV